MIEGARVRQAALVSTLAIGFTAVALAQAPQAPWRGAGSTPCIGTDGGVYKCAPPPGLVAVRAGRIFDSTTGRIVTDQTILITGDRITVVGLSKAVSVPQGTTMIYLSRATVLPGLIDAHTHMFNTRRPDMSTEKAMLIAVQNAQADLR